MADLTDDELAKLQQWAEQVEADGAQVVTLDRIELRALIERLDLPLDGGRDAWAGISPALRSATSKLLAAFVAAKQGAKP